jgi:ATP-dependent Clp protease ATP-binding subunit ClpA
VFERFTESARMVVVYAQEEARALGHPHIGAEHLLLGVVRVETAILPAGLDDIRARIGKGPG